MEEIRFVGDLQRLQPKPGDVFVLTCEQVMSAEASLGLREFFMDAMPGAKVLILDAGMKLGVIGQAPEVRSTINVSVAPRTAKDWSAELDKSIQAAVARQKAVHSIEPPRSEQPAGDFSVDVAVGEDLTVIGSFQFSEREPQLVDYAVWPGIEADCKVTQPIGEDFKRLMLGEPYVASFGELLTAEPIDLGTIYTGCEVLRVGDKDSGSSPAAADYPTLEDCKAKFELHRKFEPGQPDRKITRPAGEVACLEAKREGDAAADSDDFVAHNLLRVSELPR